MSVNHPQFGTFCSICFSKLTADTCVVDSDGVKWDICPGECARQAGIVERPNVPEMGREELKTTGRVMTDFPRRVYPCDECPVLSDNHNNPRSKFLASKWDDLRASIDDGTGGNSALEAPIFACHKGAPGTNDDLTCAGWLASFGHLNLRIRVNIAMGRLDPAALSPGQKWPPLYKSWKDMVDGQTLMPGDPTDHLSCEAATDGA